MGVPAFYRWLVGKYPKVVMQAVEESGRTMVDTSRQNPNGMEFDNLYLDMNGIIHPCFHPDDQLSPPRTYNEVFKAMFEYTDRIFGIVRPRKLLYMAIDGVAPRAKMNQQRARRFKTAKDAQVAEEEEKKLRKEFEREGKMLLPKEENEVSDINVITPGTIFMEKLSKALEYYIRLRLNSDPGWKEIKVILSDANVPGEGEHKIMSFIRLQRNLPGYNPNTQHCLYGLDADLIMLALATHEAHFFILREDVLKQEQEENVMRSLDVSLSRREHYMLKPKGFFEEVTLATRQGNLVRKPYQFLNIAILRDYLELDMKIPDPPYEIDIERIIDDFIFICFFTGNDFLPHLPSLEIHEGGIDLLIAVYKMIFKTNGGYLVDTSRMKDRNSAYIKAKRVEKFILEVGSFEEKIFEKREKMRQKKLQRLLRERAEEGLSSDDFDSLSNSGANQYDIHKDSTSTLRNSEIEFSNFSRKCRISTPAILKNNTHDVEFREAQVVSNTKELRQKLKDQLHNGGDLFKTGAMELDKSAMEIDKVGLAHLGWKDRYYRVKFCVESPQEIKSIQKTIVNKYVEGLCWVLQYYFVGVGAWSWYYPFYYGPFASDLKRLSCFNISFKLGRPFKPFDQLMAVSPPQSSAALPEAYRKLMINKDSAIIKFYPEDFVVDMDGKRFMWQGIPKLPFIDEELLIAATVMIEKELKSDEVDRNSFKFERIFVRDSHALGRKIISIYTLKNSAPSLTSEDEAIDCARCGLSGFITMCVNNLERSYFSSPMQGMEDIRNDQAICAQFKNPDFHEHIPRLLQNVEVPVKKITEADIVERKLWHEYEGRQPQLNTNRQRYASNFEDGLKSAPETWKPAGSGWGGTGRGRSSAPAELYMRQEQVGLLATSGGRGNGSMGAVRGYRLMDGNFVSNGSTRNNYVNGGLQSWSRLDRRDFCSPTAAGHGRGRGRGLSQPQSSQSRWQAKPDRSSASVNGGGESRCRWQLKQSVEGSECRSKPS